MAVYVGAWFSGVTVDLTDPSKSTADAAGDTFTGIEVFQLSAKDDKLIGTGAAETVYGGSGKDELHGNGGADELYGEDGNDLLRGGRGDDRLYGGAGDDILTDAALDGRNDGNDRFYGGDGRDVLLAGAGDDVLNGGAGADSLNGSDGFDTASYHDAGGAVTVDRVNAANSTGDAAGDVYLNIEAFELSGSSDTFIGNGQAETVYGGGGGDTVWGGGGDDRLIGDQGSSHYSGADMLFGEAGNDYLDGGGRNDTLSGGTGADILIGGGGADKIEGGAGADKLVYRSTSDSKEGWNGGVDLITDFAQGEDIMDLSLIDANEAVAGDQAFSFLDEPGTYSGDWSGLIWTKIENGVTTVYASTNADDLPEMQISLAGTYQLAADDFIL
jgi:Ca2+-binding RTX toxin-like protein